MVVVHNIGLYNGCYKSWFTKIDIENFENVYYEESCTIKYMCVFTCSVYNLYFNRKKNVLIMYTFIRNTDGMCFLFIVFIVFNSNDQLCDLSLTIFEIN